MTALMLFSVVPMALHSGTDGITAFAAAEKITNGNKIGVLNSFTTGWDAESQSYNKITEIIFDSVEYEVAENAVLSYSTVNALAGKDVLVRFQNGRVTAIEDAKKQTTDISVSIEPVDRKSVV